MMSRRFLHQWFRDWALTLTGMVVILTILWLVTGFDLLAGALVTASFSLAMVAIGWWGTR